MAAISFIGRSFTNAKIKYKEIVRNDSECHIHENKRTKGALNKIKPKAAFRFGHFHYDISIVHIAHAKSHSEWILGTSEINCWV